MSPARWTADIPSQAGRTVVVTGANSGIGSMATPWAVGSSTASHDRDGQRMLWERSAELTGVCVGVARTPS